eukprot:scaffold140860_cov47-Prasinocladus_malaysianus.AAC.3
MLTTTPMGASLRFGDYTLGKHHYTCRLYGDDTHKPLSYHDYVLLVLEQAFDDCSFDVLLLVNKWQREQTKHQHEKY